MRYCSGMINPRTVAFRFRMVMNAASCVEKLDTNAQISSQTVHERHEILCPLNDLWCSANAIQRPEVYAHVEAPEEIPP